MIYNTAMTTIRVTSPLRPYINGDAEIQVDGHTVGEAMDMLMEKFPAFRPHLYKDDGTLRAFVNLFVDGQNIKDLQGLETVIESNTIIQLIPSIAGG